MRWWLQRSRLAVAVSVTAVAGLAATGCGSGAGSSSSGQVPASAKQTIVFATSGLGGEGAATKAAIAGFEKLHPNIKVSIYNVSSLATVAQQQEEHGKADLVQPAQAQEGCCCCCCCC